MALASSKSVFIHIPKCAGIFIRNVYRLCGIDHRELGEQHSHFPELLDYWPGSVFKQLYVYTFIRHPLTWYQSRWAFRVKNGWKLQHPLDLNCASNDFQTFVQNVLKYKPDGWLTAEYRNYIDAIPFGTLKFIGRVENLIDDLLLALHSAGEKFDESIVRIAPRVNDSDMDGRSSLYWARYTPELIDAVLAAEREVIDKYYSNFSIDPKILL